MTDTLKALSLWQPWGSLWLSPNKRHETRPRRTSHRGHLLVHAAKKIETDVDEELAGILDAQFGPLWSRRLPIGAIIGMVDLVGVIPTEELYDARGCYDPAGFTIYPALDEAERTDRASGNFCPGRFGWRRGSYWRFPQAIPYRGRQTLFDVPREVVAEQIAAAVEVCP